MLELERARQEVAGTHNPISAKEIMEILLNQDDVDATQEASNDQYGLDDKLLDELLDRSDIVKVSIVKFHSIPYIWDRFVI